MPDTEKIISDLEKVFSAYRSNIAESITEDPEMRQMISHGEWACLVGKMYNAIIELEEDHQRQAGLSGLRTHFWEDQK